MFKIQESFEMYLMGVLAYLKDYLVEAVVFGMESQKKERPRHLT